MKLHKSLVDTENHSFSFLFQAFSYRGMFNIYLQECLRIYASPSGHFKFSVSQLQLTDPDAEVSMRCQFSGDTSGLNLARISQHSVPKLCAYRLHSLLARLFGGNWHFFQDAASLTFHGRQLHPVPSYVILESITMGKSTTTHSLSDLGIFMHIYEGVIPLNVAVLLCWGLFWFTTQKKKLLFSKICNLYFWGLENDTWQTRQVLC